MVPRSKRFQRPSLPDETLFGQRQRETERRRRDSGKADRSADKHAELAGRGFETGVRRLLIWVLKR